MSAKKHTPSTFKPEYLYYKYYVQFGGKALGPYRMDELRKLDGFTLQTPMRRTPQDEWNPAFTVMNMKAYFSSANDVKAWSQAAAQLDRERARIARKGRRTGLKWFFGLLVIGSATAGVLYYLQTSGRMDVKTRIELLIRRLPASVRSNIPALQKPAKHG